MKRLAIGYGIVEWVAKRTNEYGNFGAAHGIGLQVLRPPDPRMKKTIHPILDSPRWETIAGVVYAEWNGVNVVCHIASDKTRRWLNREYLWTIFDYPFNQLGVRRITVCVGEGNSNSRRFVEHLGFGLETTLRSAHPSGDLLVYAMFKESCKWISADFYKPLAKAA